MYRALPVPRQVNATAGRGLVRVTRRRLATESTTTPLATPPKKSKSIVRRIVFYSTAAAGTFYASSAFVAFNNQRYYDFFVQSIPGGRVTIEFAERNNWDTLTVAKAIEYGVDSAKSIQRVITGQAKEVKGATEGKAEGVKDRFKTVTSSLITQVHKTEDKISGKVSAIERHQAQQFSDGVDDLVRKAEAVLAGKPLDSLPEATTTPEQPAGAPPDASPIAADKPGKADAGKNVYEGYLPLGFEPPPGYTRPTPPKSEAPHPPVKADAPQPPLPLVAPAVSELGVSEPVISHLASTIDNLASYLNSNPAAAAKAKDVLETAKTDLTELSERIEKVRAEERSQLERSLDEKTREYTIQLLELEMEAQDKLDGQEQDFRKLFDQERASIIQAYRAKLDQELQTQTELINERLKEEVIAQGIEMQRRWIRDIKVRVEQERGGRLAKLDELAANLKRLERLALDNSSYLDENIRIHAMWSALRAVNNAIESPVRQPFREELRVLRHIAAAREDPIVSSALETLESSDVPDIGVEPFADLASWFSTSVAPRVTSVALVPDQNAGVLSHVASHVFSTFRFQRHGLVPGSDVLSVLARAEYYMNEKDLDSAARELNQLRGTARVLLQDWLEAARRRLEVAQALDVVQSQATLASLLVV
ncbi:hypothetical protein PLICRDRAFT_116378 [Plicaturopsis crispa FD-325 SS-3]|uniref:MICOS complex subunit MIC60 n=1 Tax=Plicaturopsis crispa FD-325 SS-3 TaxID=944288 RepID=A0A0C9SL95_PLICR|nr:hypothetical protein PLICRDRAFT_116378 [Plicaturopsis crispa FD-325 SS-3]